MKAYKSDLKVLGLVACLDDLVRKLDFHALRKSACMLLLANGAPTRVVQAIMRHSDITN
jgi:site-specific recombinase XerD